MIDNIGLIYPKDEAWKRKVKNIEKRLNTNVGHVGNMAIIECSNHLVICGSIPKYYQGENITPLGKQGLRDSIERFFQETGLYISNGVIKSLEVGFTCVMKESVGRYLGLFGSMGDKKRTVYDVGGVIDGVRYTSIKNTGGTEFYLYDKEKEAEKNIPDDYKGLNLLRLEYRIKKRQRIKELFGKDLRVSDLLDDDIRGKLKEQFRKNYEEIPKTGGIVFINLKSEIDRQEFYKLCAEQFRQLKPDNFNSLIAELKNKGLIQERTLKRLKADLKDMKGNYTVSTPHDLIEELNEKIEMYL